MVLTASVFLAGIAIGWLLATYWTKAATYFSGVRAGAAADRPGTVKTYRMEIRCLCGSLLKFRDPVGPGYQPFPTGDSVTCPNCGRVKDLKEIRELQKDVSA